MTPVFFRSVIRHVCFITSPPVNLSIYWLVYWSIEKWLKTVLAPLLPQVTTARCVCGTWTVRHASRRSRLTGRRARRLSMTWPSTHPRPTLPLPVQTPWPGSMCSPPAGDTDRWTDGWKDRQMDAKRLVSSHIWQYSGLFRFLTQNRIHEIYTHARTHTHTHGLGAVSLCPNCLKRSWQTKRTSVGGPCKGPSLQAPLPQEPSRQRNCAAPQTHQHHHFWSKALRAPRLLQGERAPSLLRRFPHRNNQWLSKMFSFGLWMS